MISFLEGAGGNLQISRRLVIIAVTVADCFLSFHQPSRSLNRLSLVLIIAPATTKTSPARRNVAQ